MPAFEETCLTTPTATEPLAPAAPRTAAPRTAAIVFLEKLGRALHRYGSPAHRLEEAMTEVARRLGLRGQFFSTPTAIFASFETDHADRRHDTVLLRVEPGDVDLEKLSWLDVVVSRVVRGELAPRQAAAAVDALEEAPHRYGAGLTTAAYAAVSASAACFFGGGWRELLAAGGVGILIGLLALAVGRFPSAGRVFELLSATLAAFVTAVSAELAGVAPQIVTVAGLIVLIPGFTLTVAMTELATRHLVSGSARLSGAALVFLVIGFGVALGKRLGEALVGAGAAVVPETLPRWAEAVALAVAAAGFTVLFRAHPRDAGWVLAGGTVAYAGSRLGAALLGPELGAFMGAALVGVASNAFARWRDRPAAIAQLPGLMLLVPGSIGFRGVSSFLAHDALSGVQSAFTMALVAIALVTGLLLANVLVPPRRAL